MALQSQFNLSVELTKLVPFGSLVNTASRGLLSLARELRKSGSDIVAEQDLAEIFGRNRIESKFASTFRTAVRKSTIHRLSEAAEIVLEAGAGPTVKRSLTEQAYTSMIIQLSLLTWTHELSSLARALTKALERRLQGSGGYHDFPDQETLKGTLRACREQTSGFMWELIFIAVETKLTDVGYTQRPSCSRPIPFHMLQALLDAFTAVQYFPDERFIRMETWEGVVTIVVWAHTLLGLTVAVHNDGESICFGQGREQVLIDCELRERMTDTSCIALLNAAEEVHFSLTPDPFQEPMLEPACRHPALEYGDRLLSFDVEDHTVIREIAHRVVASCLIVVAEAVEHLGIYNADRIFIPSRRQILDAGSLLFKDLNYDPRYFDRFLQEPCLLRSEWESSDVLKIMQGILGGHYQDQEVPVRKTFGRLCYILLAFANVLDITTCAELPLDTYSRVAYSDAHIRLPTISESFDTLARLLLGSSQYDEAKVKKAALLSSWGWSIFFSSVNSHDPGQLRREISIRRGVPCRFGERKEWIIDSYNMIPTQYGNPLGTEGSSQCTVIAQPGDTVRLQDLNKARRSRYFIDVSGPAFEVIIQLECDADQIHGNDQYVSLRVGLRRLQEIWWRTLQLPECSHPAKLGDEAVVPDDTDCFSGLSVHLDIPGRELDTHLTSEKGWVLVGLVAGNPAARWILMQAFQSWFTRPRRGDPDIKPPSDGTVVLRGPNCCLACAMEKAGHMRNGKPIGLIL